MGLLWGVPLFSGTGWEACAGRGSDHSFSLASTLEKLGHVDPFPDALDHNFPAAPPCFHAFEMKSSTSSSSSFGRSIAYHTRQSIYIVSPSLTPNQQVQRDQSYSKMPPSVMSPIRHQIPKLLRPAPRDGEELFGEEGVAERLFAGWWRGAGRHVGEGESAGTFGSFFGAAVLLCGVG